MFTAEGLGASRDNFSTNLARLKNLRQRIGEVHREREAVLAQASQSAECEVGTSPEWVCGIDLHWLAQDQREWFRNEHHTTLEMMFIYLLSILDAFFGQWCAEHQLSSQGKWPAATPDRFRKVGLVLHPAAERQLVEYRARRNVLVHRGGIADAEYCKLVHDRTRLRHRLQVDESYLDTAAEFIDHLAAATAVAKYTGPPRHEAKDLWPSLIARVFARVCPNTS
jgi:hypothetical protein